MFHQKLKTLIILRLTNINLVFTFEECGWNVGFRILEKIFKIIVLEIV